MTNNNNKALNTLAKGFTTVKGISVVLGILVSMGGIVAIIDQYAPWAWAGEFKEIAGMSCSTAINQKFEMLLITEKQLLEAQAVGNERYAFDLEKHKHRLKAELEHMKRKCDKYYQ